MKKLNFPGWPGLIACLLLLVVLLISCTQKKDEITPSPQFASYIHAYTGGVVSQSSVIRIELAGELPMVELHSPLKKNPFSFSPSLKGKAWWVNNKTIEFVPDQGALRPGKLYQATFRLGDFMEVDKELEKFVFTFRVMERNFAMDVDLPYITAEDPSRVNIEGVLRLSDSADPATVEQMFSLKTHNGQTPSLVLEPGATPDRYRFSISGLTRTAEEETLRIEVSGKPFGTDHILRKTVLIPASGDFRFLAAQRISTPEQGLRVTFSDPVSAQQDLRGLINLYGIREYTQWVDGNRVDLYFDPLRATTYTLEIDAGLHNYAGKLLGEIRSVSFSEEAHKPEVKLTSTGTILPDSRNLLIPFSAVSLRAVDLTVVRIFENNVLMFLQDNSLSSSTELRRSGRMVYRKTLRLDQDPSKDLTEWNDFSIDLSRLIQQEPGAIYRVMLSFKQDYSLYPCSEKEEGVRLGEGAGPLTSLLAGEEVDYDHSVWDTPSTYYYMENDGYNWREYDWQQRDNPCHPSYYMLASRKASRNVLATNLGLLIKRNEGGKMWFTVADLLTTEPVNQAEIIVYNFQLQPIGQAKTDSEGLASLEIKGVPFVAVASKERQKTYLKLVDGEELSVSRFDVGGKKIEKGLKGFIYGERGVWRPGDTLHANFILEDRDRRIPESHPVSLELFTPQGQFHTRQVAAKGVNGFYTFKITTRAEDPTGVWNGYVKAGGTAFHKPFRIETVKPNRLKIETKLPELLEASDHQVAVTLSSTWLTGAVASGLKADAELVLNRTHTRFDRYGNYTFNDPASDFESSKQQVYKGTLDKEGKTTFSLHLPQASNAPGMLLANLITRVYEPGGDASIHTSSVSYSPFTTYVGINLNENKGKYLETDQDHPFDIVTLNSAGKPVDRRNLEYRIYKIGWSWWWENRAESLESYVHNSSVVPVASGNLATNQGKGKISFRVNYPDWGRYLVYVKDVEGGHATGGTIVVDWPDWRGRSDKSNPSGVTMLSFSTDKESYQAGESATVYIPAAAQGRALVSIESGTTVFKQEWVDVDTQGDTKYRFRIEPEMAPNVYLHITLLQPHGQTVNDLPIRMYGVVPVMVDNPASKLEPQLTMPDVLRPEQPFTLTVSEKKGHPMTYTLAIVDDGLLDLTAYRTPDPWNYFYSREALGVRTWDMYHQVVGAYSGSYGPLFSTGGDEMLKNQDAKANRFRPVVKVLGPFTLKKGGKDKHTVTLPMYVGSVRTMVVAGNEGAYGNAEKTTPVRTPLMVLSTLPRVLSIGEEILLPVNVFAMEQEVKQVTVKLETSSNLSIGGAKQQAVTFSEPGDRLVMFRIRAGEVTGKAQIRIEAGGNGQSATEHIEIEIRNPHPAVTERENRILEAGTSVKMEYVLSGTDAESWPGWNWPAYLRWI